MLNYDGLDARFDPQIDHPVQHIPHVCATVYGTNAYHLGS